MSGDKNIFNPTEKQERKERHQLSETVCLLSRSPKDDIPPWVKTITSDNILGFALPLTFWILASIIIYLIYGWGRNFTLIIWWVWCAITLSAFSFALIFFIAMWIASDFVDEIPSKRSSFSDFYKRSASLVGWKRRIVIALGIFRAILMVVGFSGLFGGAVVMWLLLSSGISFNREY